MAKKEIPARTIWTCDCCGNELTKSNWYTQGMVNVSAVARDFSGGMVGEERNHYDLCDTCFHAVQKAIIETIKGKETPCHSA